MADGVSDGDVKHALDTLQYQRERLRGTDAEAVVEVENAMHTLAAWYRQVTGEDEYWP